MRGNRSKHTKPEILLRKALWARGLRYRLHAKDLPGKPDIVFRRAWVVVFCDGDFWHGRDWEQRRAKLADGANPDYWINKIASNRERAVHQSQELEAAGWLVLRFWES